MNDNNGFNPYKRGGNCNIVINKDGETVRKYLRNTSSVEKIERFRRELRVSRMLINKHLKGIVEIYDVHEEQKIDKSYIEIKKYDGSLEDIVYYTMGNIKRTLKLVFPLVKALQILSNLESPIYHRDIKPDNILYSIKDGEYSLFLADFGCCYIEDARITNDNITVGSRVYVAPEYEIGKVGKVDEKGDIFSIGKIIWYMINGEKDDLLPYNLWYIDEYNLEKRFPKINNIPLANYIIAQCLKIESKDRCNYDALLTLMENILNDHIIYNNEDVVKTIAYQEKLRNEIQERFNGNLNLVKVFCLMFSEVLKEMNYKYNDFVIINQITQNFDVMLSKINKGYIDNIRKNAAHYICSFSYDRLYFSINYIPFDKLKKNCQISISYSISSKEQINKEANVFYGVESGIYFEYRNEEVILSKQCIYNFVADLVNYYITA